jgi:hypothetical protein
MAAMHYLDFELELTILAGPAHQLVVRSTAWEARKGIGLDGGQLSC